MIKLFFLLILLTAVFSTSAQTLWTENFQSYQGIGSNLTSGWQTSGPGGFKVYIRAFPDSNNKVVEIALAPSKTGDSLITPAFGPLSANAVLTFKSRLVDTYTGITATFNHIPAAGYVVSAYVSADNGNSYQFLQNLLPNYPNSSTAMVNYSLPINGYEGSSVKVKFVTRRTAGSWFASFDDFAAANLTAGKSIQSTPEMQLAPNPGNGKVWLSTSGFTGSAQIEVFDILGNKVRTYPLTGNRQNLDLTDLKKGVYLIKVSEGKQVQIKRLVINN
jgi:hypothetical protein